MFLYEQEQQRRVKTRGKEEKYTCVEDVRGQQFNRKNEGAGEWRGSDVEGSRNKPTRLQKSWYNRALLLCRWKEKQLNVRFFFNLVSLFFFLKVA